MVKKYIGFVCVHQNQDVMQKDKKKRRAKKNIKETKNKGRRLVLQLYFFYLFIVFVAF